MDPVIRVERVSKRFGRQQALEDVSFEVPGGGVFALLGENGAGKTTAIKILLGLTEADTGQCHVLGLDSRRRGTEIRRAVGYVSERPTLYEWMTVDEIGWFAAGFYGNGFLPRYRELTSQLTLPAGQKIKNLSKGMRAKVTLSLALAPDPAILVLDEPTSGLDTIVRREFLESMVDRAATGRTVFLSSHQIHEVERVADRVAILREGKLLLVEPLDQLKREIVELTVTLADGASLPTIPGQVLSERHRARQWQAIVRGLSDEQLAALRQQLPAGAMEVRSPNLEEIFVAYMRRPESRSNTNAEGSLP